LIDLNNLNGFSLFLFYYLFFSPNIVCCRRLTSVLRFRFRFRFRHLREKNSIIIDITQIYICIFIYNRFVASYISEKKLIGKNLFYFVVVVVVVFRFWFSPTNNNEIIAVEIEEIKIRQENRKRVEKKSFLE
jgi:hypothetical protein